MSNAETTPSNNLSQAIRILLRAENATNALDAEETLRLVTWAIRYARDLARDGAYRLSDERLQLATNALNGLLVGLAESVRPDRLFEWEIGRPSSDENDFDRRRAELANNQDDHTTHVAAWVDIERDASVRARTNASVLGRPLTDVEVAHASLRIRVDNTRMLRALSNAAANEFEPEEPSAQAELDSNFVRNFNPRTDISRSLYRDGWPLVEQPRHSATGITGEWNALVADALSTLETIEKLGVFKRARNLWERRELAGRHLAAQIRRYVLAECHTIRGRLPEIMIDTWRRDEASTITIDEGRSARFEPLWRAVASRLEKADAEGKDWSMVLNFVVQDVLAAMGMDAVSAKELRKTATKKRKNRA